MTRRLLLGQAQLNAVDICQDQLTFSQNVEFKGSLVLQIANALQITPGVKVASRGYMLISAARIDKAQAQLLSESGLIIKGSQLDNSYLGEVKSHGQLTLEVNHINNCRGTILSQFSSLLWSPKQNGLLDNEDGKVRAQKQIRLGHTVGHRTTGEAILRNENGKVISDRSSVITALYHIQNCFGSIKGVDICLRLASLDNRKGSVEGVGLVKILAQDSINNLHGKLIGAELSVRTDGEFANDGGLLQGDEVRLCADSLPSFDEGSAEPAPLGEFAAGKGGILLSSQQALSIQNDFRATGPIQIVSGADITNSRNFSLSSEQTIVLSSGTRFGSVKLTNCSMKSSLVKVLALNGAVFLNHVKGVGDISSDAMNCVDLAGTNWTTQKSGMALSVGPDAAICMTRVGVNGKGQLSLRGRDERDHQLPCLAVDLSHAKLQIEELDAHCLGSLNAHCAHLSVDRGRLQAKELNLTSAVIHTSVLNLHAASVAATEAQISAGLIRTIAQTVIDLSSTSLRGQFQLKAPVIYINSSLLMPSAGNSAIQTTDLQTDEKSLLAGEGSLSIDTDAECLRGKVVLDDRFSMKSTHQRLTNKLEIQADEVSLAFEGSFNNSADISSRIAKFYGKGHFDNLAKIEAEEGVSILTKSFRQGDEGETVADTVFLHTSDNLSSSVCERVFGNRALCLLSSGNCVVDRQFLSSGSILVVNHVFKNSQMIDQMIEKFANSNF